MSKPRKLDGLSILFVTNWLYLSEQPNRLVRNGYFTQNLSKLKHHNLVWNAFYKQLLRPYGKIEAALTTKQIKEKLNPKNCEWFTRPKVARSEMAETCSENIAGASQVLRRWLQDEITRMIVKCKEAVHPLNTKNDAPVTPEVVSKMRQFHCTNKANEVKFFEDMEKLANSFQRDVLTFFAMKIFSLWLLVNQRNRPLNAKLRGSRIVSSRNELLTPFIPYQQGLLISLFPLCRRVF